MVCSQCQGIEELFSQKYVNKELARYRSKGPDRTTHMLTEAIQAEGVSGLTLLDIGGGLGAVQHALLDAGAEQALAVDASTAYLAAAEEEARRRNHAGRVAYRHGNFIDLAADIPPADIVTLDRVICCYPEMEQLVARSAERARMIYALVYPRDTWWMKIALLLENLFFMMRRSPFRAYLHSTQAVEAILAKEGLKRRIYRRTLGWQVAVYTR